MMQKNSTFRGAEPTWANACVGNNGNPGYWEYSKGFSKAANILIAKVLDAQCLTELVDQLIYPVCFNMRHSVELRLKWAIENLQKLQAIKNQQLEFNLSGSHDIGHIWRFFKKESELFDARFSPLNKKINPTLVDISEVDATGQTFRYPINSESKRHLTDVGVINFLSLRQRFTELEKALDELHDLIEFLIDEYSTGTFTKNLSRRTIQEIANRLPDKEKWKDKSFDDIKNKLKAEYNIGSKELSEAIDIIKQHHEFSTMIGIHIPLLGISENRLRELIDIWGQIHPVGGGESENDSYSCTSEMLLSLMRESESLNHAWSNVKEWLDVQQLAGFSSLYYLPKEQNYSEGYRQVFETKLVESEQAFKSGEMAVRSVLFHILDKTNMVVNIHRSMKMLGRIDFV